MQLEELIAQGRFLTPDEAGEILGITGTTFRKKYIARRRVPFIRLGHRTVRIHPAELSKLIERLTR